ncbi:sensor histidine kinase [Comamonas odontotermitis]|uniref:sensor histidine kinase n=1 Tax=Comamonas odontotermitis TaxID=379895 RepID=UPI001CC34937|nr:ATP-binding protein [Comamonas odontotermitis]UBB18556.1 ATP-binding protein [Comamonas odontotermitis]
MRETSILREKISRELAKTDPDWHLIEKLTREQVDSGTENVRFSVDAGHIKRLGLELVARQETALAELIKNAYDADSTTVNVFFENYDRPNGTLIIEDDGDGMSLDTVRDTWMRLSTANKQNHPVSPRYARVRAGRKGIGRFAVQRLGKYLELETEIAGSASGIRVLFDWDREFHSGKNLNDVFSVVTTYTKPIERHRTKLTIKELRERWSEASISRVWRTVLLLQPPFGIKKIESIDEQAPVEDPGFEVQINGISSRNKKTSIAIGSDFLDHAIAEISGEIDSSGKAVAYVTSKKLNLKESLTLDSEFLLTGTLSFKTYYFIFSPDALSGLKRNVVQEMGREYGGIRIYRNGFRVSPYGERTDDWLKLDADTSRRTLLVPANNINFFGQVALSLEDNPLFEETSSREGLIENEAFEELRKFIRGSIEWAILRVAALRGRKQTASQRDFTSTTRLKKPSEVLEEFAGIVEEEANANSAQYSSHKFYESAFSKAKEKILEWENNVEQKQTESLQYEEMLRILASLGLSVSMFGHEIKGMRSSVAANVLVLQRHVDILDESSQKKKIQEITQTLSVATNRMFDLGAYVSGLMTSNESRELRTLSVKGAIERFLEQFSKYLERQKISVDFSIQRAELRTTEMHSSELDSILLNFLTNSVKSMKSAKVNLRRIKIYIEEDGENILLSFQDNGTGISKEIREKIFDAFFTTTTETDSDGLAGPGTGLGLKIVSDIANSYGGSVTVGIPDHDYSCNIELRLPSSHKKAEK